MPLPLLILGASAIAGALGVGGAVKGGLNAKEAHDTMQLAKRRHEHNTSELKKKNTESIELMDSLGERELKVLSEFKQFEAIFEEIKNKPEFQEIVPEGIRVERFSIRELRETSIGANILFGALGSAAAGTAGGFAAAGATTAAVMALGTASTGTAIASLSGAAATNATLAALGGGSLAAGGMGMAGGAMVLGVATLGVGLLVGGIILGVTGSSLLGKADEAYSNMLKAEQKIQKIYNYLEELDQYSKVFLNTFIKVEKAYQHQFKKLIKLVREEGKVDWNLFSTKEKMILENVVLLVTVLYSMCKVPMVIIPKEESALSTGAVEEQLHEINKEKVSAVCTGAEDILEDRDFIVL